MHHALRPRAAAAILAPVLLLSVSACDIVTADYKVQDRAEWRKSYELAPGGRLEISNVNGKIDVEPSTGNTVEVLAVKTARGASQEDARQALERIEIAESVSPSAIRIETRIPKGTGIMRSGGTEVRYTIKVPASAETRFTTVNGGIDITGLIGRIDAETTNGGITARDVGGAIEASTTNGGVDVDVTRITEGGVKLACTNGGIRLRLPSESKATISASVTNGGIDTGGLKLDSSESSRRKLEARLNGGGPAIRISGTNGGIKLSSR
jgi:hypothetical protein